MRFAPSLPARRRAWALRIGFVLICAAFAGLRHGLEARRQWELAEWQKQSQLKQKFLTTNALNPQQTMATFTQGQPLPPAHPFRPDVFDIAMRGTEFGQQFEGWTVLELVTRERVQGVPSDTGTITGWRILPPPWLSAEPSPLWWGVERLRVGAMWMSLVTWLASLALMIAVRGIHRRAAEICFAAGGVCLLAVFLDSDFTRRQILHPLERNASLISTGYSSQQLWRLANHPVWFDVGAVLALVAGVIWLIPSRK